LTRLPPERSPINRFLPRFLREGAAPQRANDSRALVAAEETSEPAIEGVSAIEKYGAVGEQVASVLAAAEAAATEIQSEAAREAEEIRASAHREAAEIRHEAEAIRAAAEGDARALTADAERRVAEIEEAARLRSEERGLESRRIEERFRDVQIAVREATETLEKYLAAQTPAISPPDQPQERNRKDKRAARPKDD
jgi:hypothetical protein